MKLCRTLQHPTAVRIAWQPRRCIDLERLGQRSVPERVPGAPVARHVTSNPPYHLTRRRFSVNCIFPYGLDCTNRSRRSRHRLRLPPAGGSVFLRALPAGALARATPPRYRGASRGPSEVASRRRARPGTTRHFLSHGRISAPRTRHLRFPRWVGRPEAARSVASPLKIILIPSSAVYLSPDFA